MPARAVDISVDAVTAARPLIVIATDLPVAPIRAIIFARSPNRSARTQLSEQGAIGKYVGTGVAGLGD